MFKVIPEFPQYQINEEGVVISFYKYKTSKICDTPRVVQPVMDNGYWLVTLVNCDTKVRKNKRVHRLLAEIFIPNPENKPQVNHIDGNKGNYTLSNLEWATGKENSQHAVANGLTTYEHCMVPIFQYTKDLVLIKEFKSFSEAQKETGIWMANIGKVARGLRNTAGGYVWRYS